MMPASTEMSTVCSQSAGSMTPMPFGDGQIERIDLVHHPALVAGAELEPASTVYWMQSSGLSRQ